MPATAHDARRAYQGALAAAVLNALVTPLDLLVGRRSVPDLPAWPVLAAAAVGGAIALFLIARRGHVTVRTAALSFVVNNASIVAALWIRDGYFARGARAWVPFQAHKLGALAVALLAPNLWSGVASIVGFAGSAIVRYALFPAALKARLALGEPWASLAFGLFGVALLVHHLRGRAKELALVHALVQAAALERCAEKLTAVRDLTNTPLQIMELTVAVMHRRTGAPSAEDFDVLKRAIARMREINIILAQAEAALRWSKEQESIDARASLRFNS
jgi:hypothetical protein